MSPLRLGAYRLPAAEIVLLRIMVRLLSHDKAFNWIFVEAGPYDAIITDEITASTDTIALSQLTSQVLKIVRVQEESAPDTLTRPLRAEKIKQALLQISASLTRAPTSSEAVSEIPLITRYKLRRWPPTSVVRNDPMLIRMAVLLSKRPLLPIELAHLSQQSLDACHRFIETLRPIGLLDVVSVAGPSVTSSPALPQNSIKATESKPLSTQGLISRIRRRIGL